MSCAAHHSFAEGALRGRALGLNGALLAGGFTVGALLGGVVFGLRERSVVNG